MRWPALKSVEVWIGLLAVGARLLPGPRTIDDAYITFRYARNLLSGHGLVYNPGEAILGTTTPLYALLLAAAGAPAGGSQAPFPAIAWLLNAAAGGLTCMLIIRIAEQLGFRPAGVAAGLVWAIAPMSVTFDIGGMETEVTIALMAATFHSHLSARRTRAALFAALSLLARPDTLLFIAPLALERLRAELTISRQFGQVVRRLWKEAGTFALALAGWSAFAFPFYGAPIPLTIAAKAVAYRLPPEAAFVRLLQHYSTPFLGHLTFGTWWIAVGLALYPILSILGIVSVLRRRPEAWPYLIYPWLYLAAFSLANPLIFRWYLAPPLPAYFLTITLGIDRISADLGRRWIFVALTACACVLTLRGWTLRPDHGPSRPAPEMAFVKLELLYEQVGHELAEVVQPGQVLAAGDIGALGYYSEARMLDTVGLISPAAGRYYPLPAEAYVINYAIPAALIEDLRPDYLVILEVYARRTLLTDPAFASAYKLLWALPTDLYGSEGMLVFERNAPP